MNIQTMTAEQLEPIAEALRKNNMNAYCVEHKEQVLPLLSTLIKSGDTVAVGGSQSLEEIGVTEWLRSGDFHFIDRNQPGITPEQKNERMVQSLAANVYLCSSNAVTKTGELYNVDGNGNRVAALCYGPQSVVLVVGCNKIVNDLPEAVKRVKTIAAPLNTRRLQCKTPCAQTGCCVCPDSPTFAQGCASPQRICAMSVVTGFQRKVGRFHVILVGEPLGY